MVLSCIIFSQIYIKCETTICFVFLNGIFILCSLLCSREFIRSSGFVNDHQRALFLVYESITSYQLSTTKYIIPYLLLILKNAIGCDMLRAYHVSLIHDM